MAQFISAGMAQSSNLQSILEDIVKNMRDMNHKIDSVRSEVRLCQQQLDRLHRGFTATGSNSSMAPRRVSTVSDISHISHQSPPSLRSNPGLPIQSLKGIVLFRSAVRKVIAQNRARKRMRRLWRSAIFHTRKGVRRATAERALQHAKNPLERNWATRREWTISRISSDLRLMDSLEEAAQPTSPPKSLNNIISSLRSGGMLMAAETQSINDDEDKSSVSDGAAVPVPEDARVDVHFAELIHEYPATTRQKILALFDPDKFQTIPPRMRYCGSMINTLSFLAIVMSTVSFVVETIPDYSGSEKFFPVETVCVAYFTAEYVARFSVSDQKRRFVVHPMNVIDFLAIVPYYFDIFISLAGSSISITFFVVLRVLRLIRVVRVLKLSRHHEGIKDVGETILRSREAFTMMVFLLVILTVLFSSIVFFAEQSVMTWEGSINRWVIEKHDWSWNDAKQKWDPVVKHQIAGIQSIPEAFWWCIVSLTTVGYGDMVPVSPLGKFCGGLTLMMGILTIALPTMILSVNFQQVRLTRSRVNRQGTFRNFLEGKGDENRYDPMEFGGLQGFPVGPSAAASSTPPPLRSTFPSSASVIKGRVPTENMHAQSTPRLPLVPPAPLPKGPPRGNSKGIEMQQRKTRDSGQDTHQTGTVIQGNGGPSPEVLHNDDRGFPQRHSDVLQGPPRGSIAIPEPPLSLTSPSVVSAESTDGLPGHIPLFGDPTTVPTQPQVAPQGSNAQAVVGAHYVPRVPNHGFAGRKKFSSGK